jgi:transposase
MTVNEIKRLEEPDADRLFDEPFLASAAKNAISTIIFLTERIKEIEKAVKPHVQLKPEFKYLLTMPGIGNILGFTIMLEVGDISRFPTVGDYSSYCRCVKSDRLSNKKTKGEIRKKRPGRMKQWQSRH